MNFKKKCTMLWLNFSGKTQDNSIVNIKKNSTMIWLNFSGKTQDNKLDIGLEIREVFGSINISKSKSKCACGDCSTCLIKNGEYSRYTLSLRNVEKYQDTINYRSVNQYFF